MVKMDIILTADPDGNLSVAVGNPALYSPDGEKDITKALTPLQKANLKRGADTILHMIEYWCAAEADVKEGGKIEEKPDLALVSNPIPIVEFLTNDMKNNPTNDWPDVKRKLLNEMSGRTFRTLTEGEIEEFCNA